MSGGICRGAVLAIVLAVGSGRAGADPAKPINHPGPFIDVDALLFTGIGYDDAFATSGFGVRATLASGRSRPTWWLGRVSFFSPFGDEDPYTFSGELLFGRAIWLRDDYQIKEGHYVSSVPVYGVDDYGKQRVISHTYVSRSTGEPGGFIIWSDIVVAAGVRTYVFAEPNVRDEKVDPVLAPELGVWYQQMMEGIMGRSRLHMGLFAAYEPIRAAFGLFGHLEVTAWDKLHTGLHIGGIFGSEGGMEFSGTLGYEF